MRYSAIVSLCAAFFASGHLAAAPTPATLAPAEEISVVSDPVPPVVNGINLSLEILSTSSEPPASLDFYDHGQPTAYEQLMLEYVNRARADPGAEAARLDIDLNEGLAPGTIEDTYKPPLAMHPLITVAARNHSAWMLDNDTFSHTGLANSEAGDRMEWAGYVFSGSWTWGENLAWGGSTGPVDPLTRTIENHNGLFISPSHRTNLMNAVFDEVGIGILMGTFFTAGLNYNAVMATQNFSRSDFTPSPFAVGVVYYDFNGNGFYDPGEQIGGVQVEVEGGSYYTETALSGGYTLPVPGSGGTRDVTFTLNGESEILSVTFPAGINHKVDLVPTYAPPVLTGPAALPVGSPSSFSISPVFGADLYRVSIQERSPAETDLPTDLSRVEDGTSGGLNPLSTAVVYSGTHAYHLAHPEGHPTQTLTYLNPFLVGEDAELSFYSRLRWATPFQFAQVRVSNDGGNNWTIVYNQAGTDTSGESTFHLRTVDLSSYEGEEILIAFRYIATGSYYTGTDSHLGWFFDQIEFTDLLEIVTLGEEDITPGEAFSFTPDEADENYTFQVIPMHQGNPWPAGPALSVTSVAGNAYQIWAAIVESEADLPAGTLADHPLEDYSGDGLANALAFILGLNPTHHQPGTNLPYIHREGSDTPRFVYWERTDHPFALIPEVTTDLVTWYRWDDPDLPGTVTREDHGEEDGLHTYHLVPQTDLGPRAMMRLRLTEAD